MTAPALRSPRLLDLLEELVDLWYAEDASDEHMIRLGGKFAEAKSLLGMGKKRDAGPQTRWTEHEIEGA